MKLMSTYAVKISRSADIRSTLSATAGIYRKAVDFFIGVCDREWDTISLRKMQTEKVNTIESFTVKTSKRPAVPYDFGKDFYKFPCYIRRAAISEAIGKVSSYRSNLKNWETEDPRTRGKRPGYPKAGYVYRPCTGITCSSGRERILPRSKSSQEAPGTGWISASVKETQTTSFTTAAAGRSVSQPCRSAGSSGIWTLPLRKRLVCRKRRPPGGSSRWISA